VVQHDLLDEKQPPILLQTHLDTRPSDAEFETALETAYFVLIGERPTGEGLAGLVVLWEEVESISDASVAWQAVLSALMQDPDFVVY
jgi:hypothetical protein